jgi:hypothetical protein
MADTSQAGELTATKKTDQAKKGDTWVKQHKVALIGAGIAVIGVLYVLIKKGRTGRPNRSKGTKSA